MAAVAGHGADGLELVGDPHVQVVLDPRLGAGMLTGIKLPANDHADANEQRDAACEFRQRKFEWMTPMSPSPVPVYGWVRG
ncbi:MAG: hypothetical protein H0T88_11435 [Lysobacter sp.]|nr:hypothetical protein [Lysobacter sp.]